MDLKLLLWLQEHRWDTAAEIFSRITFGANELVIIVIALLAYWCFSRRYGRRILLTMTLTLWLGQFLKILVASERPWVRDSRIQPYADSKKDALGYSFPSGHTSTAAAVYGGLVHRKGLSAVWKVLAWTFVALVAFSRMYLGVHTPQDVLVGLAIGIGMVAVCGPLARLAEKNAAGTLLVWGGVFVCGLATIAVVVLKGIVELDENTLDTVKTSGAVAAIGLGGWLESRFVRFEPPAALWKGLARIALGAAVGIALLELTKGFFVAALGEVAGGFVRYFVTCLWTVFGWPLIFKKAGL